MPDNEITTSGPDLPGMMSLATEMPWKRVGSRHLQTFVLYALLLLLLLLGWVEPFTVGQYFTTELHP